MGVGARRFDVLTPAADPMPRARGGRLGFGYARGGAYVRPAAGELVFRLGDVRSALALVRRAGGGRAARVAGPSVLPPPSCARYRIRHDLCAACGYDLRATPGGRPPARPAANPVRIVGRMRRMPGTESTAGGARGGAERLLRLRVTVVRPPAGVQLCLQRGQAELVSPVLPAGAEDVTFDLTVRVKDAGPGEPPGFLGPFVQGPTGGRFVYVCVGTLSGQEDSPWTRRAKVPLTGISWPAIRAAGDAPLEARYEGTDKHGGPTCATVKLLDGWRVAD
jgi:hypothetical protein